MIKNNFLKQEVGRLIKIKGNIRGVVFHSHATYIRYREGEKGIRAVEEKLKELGYLLNFKEIKKMEWYPEALSVLVILVAKEIFNWNNSDIFEMGNSAPKYSFIIGSLIKHFLSLKKVFEEVPKHWRKHFDFGEMESYKINEKEKYIVLRIKGYKFHPIICIYHAGYFLRIAQLSIESEKITIKETKCMFKGDSYHEYIIKWE